ncbi:MAG: hypothetical protein Q8O72_00435 [Bacteroidales bacterium]|nr:hypothetical protein [Bacteroidales bacterium]
MEQTFFCSLKREHRASYVSKMASLLKPGGKLAGLLFNHEFAFEGPPYGGSSEEYQQLFQPYFEIIHFEKAKNSIKPRMNREHFVLMRKPI